MKFLLLPENNSLSHVAKCLALQDRLLDSGHEALLAVSAKNAAFLHGMGRACVVLPDLQEADGAAFPTVQWFNDPARIAACIKAEAALMKEYRPDRVLGVFRFTGKAASALAGVPYDSLICGCLLPSTEQILGFDPGEPDAELQRQHLDLFFRYAGDRVGSVMRGLGLAAIHDIREMFLGERTFLWDFPEFNPVVDAPGLHHVGPVFWHGWPYDRKDPAGYSPGSRPLALVSFGTCIHSSKTARRMVRGLTELGYQVVLAAGGQGELLKARIDHPQVTLSRFAPMHLIYPHAQLLICHGGQMTVFEAMAHRVPVLVMPLQPEQAHNARCLERIGTGKGLLPPLVFRGDSRVYTDAFDAMSDASFCTMVDDFSRTLAPSRLLQAQQILKGLDGVTSLYTHLVS